MTIPALTDVIDAYLTSLKQTRDAFQVALFQHRLTELAQAGYDGRVKFAFLPKGTPQTMDEYSTIIFSQNFAGLSLNGAKDLYTDGFSGCTGVLITPSTKGVKGGILAHIAQTGNQGEDMGAYLTKNIYAILDPAKKQPQWVASKVDITLLVGYPAGQDIATSRIEVPDLEAQIRNKCKSVKIGKIHDLRLFRERAGQFLYSGSEKTLYLLAEAPPADSKNIFGANFENLKEYVQVEQREGLKCYFVK
jgi:hypothetical protein